MVCCRSNPGLFVKVRTHVGSERLKNSDSSKTRPLPGNSEGNFLSLNQVAARPQPAVEASHCFRIAERQAEKLEYQFLWSFVRHDQESN